MNFPIVRVVIGAAAGAAIGFAVYRFIGCRDGACPLTGNPWIAMSVYAILGVLIALDKH